MRQNDVEKTAENVNSVLGYRTARSMQDRETWRFAHEHCGKLWWKIGWVMLGASIAVRAAADCGWSSAIESFSVILCMLQCAVLIFSIFPTEKALKQTFDDEGKKNNPCDRADAGRNHQCVL